MVRVVRGLGKVEAISGGELADLFFSVPVALELRLTHVAIRKQAKGHGVGGRLVGQVVEGTRFAHVSDLLTSGTSALDWVAVLRDNGGIVEDYVVVFDRNQGGREALEAADVSVHRLLELNEEFLSFASERSGLARKHLESITSYLDDPEGWSLEFLKRNSEFLTRRIEAQAGRITRSDGLEVLTHGYPQLVPELGEAVRNRLRSIGLDASLVPVS